MFLAAYWGRILDVDEALNNTEGTSGNATGPVFAKDGPNKRLDEDDVKTVEINGSVLDGWGLEPLPVARFTMIEETQEYDDDDDDDDDDESELFRQSLENYADFGDENGRNSLDFDDTNDEDDPFSSMDAFQ